MKRLVEFTLGLAVIVVQGSMTVWFVAGGHWGEVALMAMVWIWFVQTVRLASQVEALKHQQIPRGY